MLKMDDLFWTGAFCTRLIFCFPSGGIFRRYKICRTMEECCRKRWRTSNNQSHRLSFYFHLFSLLRQNQHNFTINLIAIVEILKMCVYWTVFYTSSQISFRRDICWHFNIGNGHCGPMNVVAEGVLHTSIHKKCGMTIVHLCGHVKQWQWRRYLFSTARVNNPTN